MASEVVNELKDEACGGAPHLLTTEQNRCPPATGYAVDAMFRGNGRVDPGWGSIASCAPALPGLSLGASAFLVVRTSYVDDRTGELGRSLIRGDCCRFRVRLPGDELASAVRRRREVERVKRTGAWWHAKH